MAKNMNKIVAFGSLREDITIDYDFSRTTMEPEVMLSSLRRTVGGSVYNTCRFISMMFSSSRVVYCTYNYTELIRRIQEDHFVNKALVIKYPQKRLYDYPTSIIGLKDDGEKQMLSFDPEMDLDVVNIFMEEAKDANLVYTSMYEICSDNYINIASILNDCLARHAIVMVDLCPVITELEKRIVESVLLSTSVISGNIHEFNGLLKMLELQSIKDLFRRFSTINMACVKNGSNGADLYERKNTGEIIHLSKGSMVTDSCVRNTTGCGDAFNAVIAYDLCIKEKTERLLEHAVKDSGMVSKGGLPWTQISIQN